MRSERSAAVATLTAPARRLWQGWDRFWFTPISPAALGLFRIAYGATLLIFTALLAPEIFTWFSADGMMRPGAAEKFWGATPHWSILLWYPQRPAVAIFFAVFAVAVLLLTVGLWTRFSALLVFLGLISIGHRNPLVLNGTDIVLRVMAFYLVLAPAGAALSVDRLLAIARGREGPRPALVPAWTVRLMQLQVSLIYASTVLLKLKGTDWANGTAVYYTARLEEFHRFPLPFVAHSLLLVNVLTYWTLVVECSLAFLIWVPALRKFVLINGLLLHLGIEYTMNVPQFEYVMLTTFILFCDVEGWWERMQQRWPLRNLAHARLLVDGSCEACRREAWLWHALDLCGRVELYDLGPSATAVQPLLATPAGAALRDGAAFGWLSLRAPALWPVAPLLRLPGVAHALSGPTRGLLGLPAHEATATARPPLSTNDDGHETRPSKAARRQQARAGARR